MKMVSYYTQTEMSKCATEPTPQGNATTLLPLSPFPFAKLLLRVRSQYS